MQGSIYAISYKTIIVTRKYVLWSEIPNNKLKS